jgi:hypothetical protein
LIVEVEEKKMQNRRKSITHDTMIVKAVPTPLSLKILGQGVKEIPEFSRSEKKAPIHWCIV